MFVCIDFDGTVVKHAFPLIGEDIGAWPWLKKAQDLGATFILFTMRSKLGAEGDYISEAVELFEKNGIKLFGVNENPTQKSWTTSPKAYAHMYVDDAALGVPLVRPWGERPYVDWEVVGPQLLGAVTDFYATKLDATRPR